MIDYTENCFWCKSPIINYINNNSFLIFALNYFEYEEELRIYLRPRGGDNYDKVCKNCFEFKPNLLKRELSGSFKIFRSQHYSLTDFYEFLIDQENLHFIYKEFMVFSKYEFKAFRDFLEIREYIYGWDPNWIFELGLHFEYYENMVRFHLKYPKKKYDCIWNAEHDKISFIAK